MKKLLAAIMMTVAMMGAAVPAMAARSGSGVSQATTYVDSEANDGNQTDLMEVVKIIINVIIGIVGLIAVVMIIVGGISFTTSQGDSGKVTKAKNTVLYGIVGLVVAILAFAIVNFVLTSIFN